MNERSFNTRNIDRFLKLNVINFKKKNAQIMTENNNLLLIIYFLK